MTTSCIFSPVFKIFTHEIQTISYYTIRNLGKKEREKKEKDAVMSYKSLQTKEGHINISQQQTNEMPHMERVTLLE